MPEPEKPTLEQIASNLAQLGDEGATHSNMNPSNRCGWTARLTSLTKRMRTND